MSEKFYVTTPIYYPSGNLHMGNAYTTILADAMARYKKQQGFDVYFLTGTDEHGLKIQRKAEEAGKTPQEYVDEIVEGIKKLWVTLNIDYDNFIRTTDDYHVKAVQGIFEKLHKQGDIYKSNYDGWYCTPCETFWTETQLEHDKICPSCGRPVEKASEESYFFKMGKYTDKLREYIETHPDFIKPITRRNEVLSFINSGVEDLCVSRTTFDWGIQVPFDTKHVVYVWLDALTNYINALGYNPEHTYDWDDEPGDSLFEEYWGEPTYHIVGKDILRFHAVIWPCMLMALGIPQPHQVYAHGWLLIGDSGKMSKSQGATADPVFFANKYGTDAVRYYELREMPYGEDGTFSAERFLDRLNQDLANDLGNLVSRTTAMAEKYFDGKISESDCRDTEQDKDFDELKDDVPRKVHELFDDFKFSDGLREAWALVSYCNKYIDITMPWALAKDETQKDRLMQVLYNLLDGISKVADLIEPCLPETAARIKAQVGLNAIYEFETKKGDALFPRVEVAKELEEILA